MILSDFPRDDELALILIVPHTTSIWGNRHELTKWLLAQTPLPELDEDLSDAIALERFQALDAEEAEHAKGSSR